jgi:hypothetical protein
MKVKISFNLRSDLAHRFVASCDTPSELRCKTSQIYLCAVSDVSFDDAEIKLIAILKMVNSLTNVNVPESKEVEL